MKTLALFSSDNSITDSCLTMSFQSESERPDLKTLAPVGIFTIAKRHGLDRAFIVDTSMSGFWQAYKASKASEVPFVFGLKLCVCQDMTVKDGPSLATESNVIILIRNSDGYKDLVKISSKASLDGFYYRARIDWKTLNSMLTDNLSLAVPFYSSFIARNTMQYGHAATPEFKEPPTFFVESHDLPFDELLRIRLNQYCEYNGLTPTAVHSCYYYSTSDSTAHQALKCIGKRTTLEKPQLENHSSDRFSFEAYLEKTKTL